MSFDKQHSLSYVLTEAADLDIVEIYEYSFTVFGFSQAEEYLEGLHHLFIQLTQYPNEGLQREDLGGNIYSIPFGSHLVFYIILENTITIVRVLHQSQNALDYF